MGEFLLVGALAFVFIVCGVILADFGSRVGSKISWRIILGVQNLAYKWKERRDRHSGD